MLPPARQRLLDLTAWKEPAYIFYVLGCGCAFLGTWTPLFYVGLYAIDRNLTSPANAFYLLSIITAGSIFGRLAPNFLAAKIGMYNVLIPFTFLTGILAFCFIPITNVGELSAVGVLYGFASGALISISPTIAVQLSPSRTVIGARMGMAFATVGIGMLIGTPIAGSLLNKYGFGAAFWFCGASAIAGSIILIISRGFHCGWILVKKV
jgi:predicted MFS family arabinose efflux permease